MSSKTADWTQVNQRALAADIRRVRRYLERVVDESVPPGPSEPSTVNSTRNENFETAASEEPATTALAQLVGAFGLSPFERDVLLLCAGTELDSRFAELCASANGDPSRAYPTFSLALAAIPDAHWSALAPTSPLRRWYMIELGAGSALTLSPLRVDERILHYLAGVQHLDERLSSVLDPVSDDRRLAPSHRNLADAAASAWRNLDTPGLPRIQLRGRDRDTAKQIASAIGSTAGLNLYSLPVAAIPAAARERELLQRLWEREAILTGSALLVDCTEIDALEASQAASALRFVDRLSVPLIIVSRNPLPDPPRKTRTFDIPEPGVHEARLVLGAVLGDVAAVVNGHIDRIVTQFDMSGLHIQAAEAIVATDLGSLTGDELARQLWDAMREQSRARLDGLAHRIEPAAGWDDLVLPETQRQILRDIAVHVRQRTTVYEQWGFASKGSRGLGISALFSGSSGTGKTMATEVLANELRLDLYRIDLSSVVSKYIGETEKNLRQVFDAAEGGGAILLFDEADALFGKRSEVKDSHDRYANIEVSYLLQRMEAYQGLAILTTNLKSALDSAFLRRIRFIVQFPFPDSGQRARIWEGVFPKSTPTAGLESDKLARLNVSGGIIRNIALSAAFLAAEAGAPVQMEHVLRATRSEYAKLEKTLTESEIQGWT